MRRRALPGLDFGHTPRHTQAVAWRDAQGGEPIDKRTTESLDRFQVAKDADTQRALVMGSGPSQSQVAKEMRVPSDRPL